MSIRDDLAAVMTALRVGVLIPAPTLPADQRDKLLAEIVRMRRELASDSTSNVCPFPPNAFSRKAEMSGGQRGVITVYLAGIAASRDFARLAFQATIVDPATTIELLRDNAARMDEYVTALLDTLDPDTRAEVDSLHQRARSQWPDDALVRANKPVEDPTRN